MNEAIRNATAKQWHRAYARFRRHFRQDLLDAVDEERRYAVTVAAQAICGDPYAAFPQENWSAAEIAFLAAFGVAS